MKTNLPTTTGPYWHRAKDGNEWEIVYVADHWAEGKLSCLKFGEENATRLEHMQGQWTKAHNPDEGMVLLPEKLTSENGAKYLLIGEFYEEFENPYCCEDDPDQPETLKIPISWPTIKEIYAKIVKYYRNKSM